MPLVKNKFELRRDLLVVPPSIAEPRLRDAGLAWLDMARELFSQEVFSRLTLDWTRPDDSAPMLVLALDSAKNWKTRPLMELPDAPPEIHERRQRFDAAVKKLMTRTTPEDLWAALANQRLANFGAWEFIEAWRVRVGDDEVANKTYPRFMDSQELLFHWLQHEGKATHPWL